MKNKLIILLCLALVAMAALASCDKFGGKNNECQHTLSEEWTTSETQHWHAPTCEHGEFRSEPEAHADADEDGLCDACAYEIGHEHTYADEWSSNANVHWKTATCSHTTEHTPEELHVDEDNNGYCDVCGGHAHVLDPNGTGKCTICDEQIKPVDTSNLANVIAAISGAHSKVNGGKITTVFTGRDTNPSHSTKTAKIIEYLIGNGSIYYKESSAAEVKGTDRDGEYYEANTSSFLEKWYNKESDNSIFGAYKETYTKINENNEYETVETDLMVAGASNEELLYGAYYSVSSHASAYGAEGILAVLYNKSQDLNASEYVVEVGEKNYKFSYNYTVIHSVEINDASGNNLGVATNVQYFEVSVEFSHNDDYALTNLSITCDCYTSDAGVDLSGNAGNVDLDYNLVTGEVTLRKDALADTYVITVEQTVGEKTFVNEYTKDYFTPKGFLVYSDEACETLCPDTITVSLSGNDKYARFYLQDENGQKFTSATAEGLEWTTSDESGLSCQFAIGSAFSFATSHVKFLAKAVGTYTVTLTYQDVTKTFTVNVVA